MGYLALHVFAHLPARLTALPLYCLAALLPYHPLFYKYKFERFGKIPTEKFRRFWGLNPGLQLPIMSLMHILLNSIDADRKSEIGSSRCGLRPYPLGFHVKQAGADAKLIQHGPLGVAYHRRHPISTVAVARITAHATVPGFYLSLFISLSLSLCVLYLSLFLSLSLSICLGIY